jgi:uncharacterized protein
MTVSEPTGGVGLDVAGTRLICLWQRMLWWPAERALFVADVHLGKAASFRAAGVPLPSGHSTHDLLRISALVSAHSAHHLVILGDMVHTQSSYTDALDRTFRKFRADHPDLAVTLVRGNHDRHAGDAPAAWGLNIAAEPYRLGPFACCHEPGMARGSGFELAGHLHPALSVRGARDRATLACFWQRSDGIVLPAFGSLTGNHAIQLKANEQAVVIAGQQLYLINFQE